MAYHEDSSASGQDEPWISWFCSLKGHEMFCKVERSYIEDGFNLYGLRAYVANFSDCLDLILDRIGPDDSDDSHLTQSACTLYGLIHARYIITAHGLDAMYNKVRWRGFVCIGSKDEYVSLFLTEVWVSEKGQTMLSCEFGSSLSKSKWLDIHIDIYLQNSKERLSSFSVSSFFGGFVPLLWPHHSTSKFPFLISHTQPLRSTIHPNATQYANKEFGTCPLIQCYGQPVLPIGLHDECGLDHFKLFCPKCQNVYHPPAYMRIKNGESRIGREHQVDGASFGTTFAHLFLMTFNNLVPDRPSQESAYVPRVFGFRVHSSARQRITAANANNSGINSNSNAITNGNSNSPSVASASASNPNRKKSSSITEVVTKPAASASAAGATTSGGGGGAVSAEKDAKDQHSQQSQSSKGKKGKPRKSKSEEGSNASKRRPNSKGWNGDEGKKRQKRPWGERERGNLCLVSWEEEHQKGERSAEIKY